MLFTSFHRPNEISNFTYDLVPRDPTCLAHTLAVVLYRPIAEIHGYIEEARTDIVLHEALYSGLKGCGRESDIIVNPFGRRVGWYAVARMLKPWWWKPGATAPTARLSLRCAVA